MRSGCVFGNPRAWSILAGFGVQALFSPEGREGNNFDGFARILKWLVIVVSIALMMPAIHGTLTVNEWVYFSFLFILASCGLLAYILHRHATRGAAFLILAVILSDLYGSYWFIQNINTTRKQGADYLDALLRSRKLAEFLNRQPGIFRVHMDMKEAPPNIGDLYGVQITECAMATELYEFSIFRNRAPRPLDLLNVRYIVRNNIATQPNPVHVDGQFKVYENNTYCPRAWIVHQVIAGSSWEETLRQMRESGFGPLRQAIVNDALGADLQPAEEGVVEEGRIDSYQPNQLQLSVSAKSRGLVVLSEIYFPGWTAAVNGKTTSIHKVDGVLRGVLIPAGESKVVLRYAPRSVLVGAVLTFLALLGTAGFAVLVRVWERHANRRRGGQMASGA